MRLRLPLLSLLLLSACQPQGSAPAPIKPLVPADAALASLYAQTCGSCHSRPGTGAPMPGDTAAWQARLARGEAVLLAHTVNGYRGMPAMGACADCSEEDFRRLIAFLARGEGAAP